MKDIVRIVHLPSVVQSNCYEATKNNDFIQQFIFSASQKRIRGVADTEQKTLLHILSLFFILLWILTVLIVWQSMGQSFTSLPVFIQNILNCVRKTNEAFTGLERRGVCD